MGMPFQPWRAAMVPASFAGCGFYVEAGGKRGGRRIAEHEYPKEDTPFGEDMGRKAHRWTITGYCIGPYYFIARDALIAACDSEGPYTLVHPSLGEEQVHCDDYSVHESKDRGGYCTFEFVFVEAGQDPGTATTNDTQSQASSAAGASNATSAATVDGGLSGQGGIGSDTGATAGSGAGSVAPISAPPNVGDFPTTYPPSVGSGVA